MAENSDNGADDKRYFDATKESLEDDIKNSRNVVAMYTGYLNDSEKKLQEKERVIKDANSTDSANFLADEIATLREAIADLKKEIDDATKSIEADEKNLRDVKKWLEEHAEKYGSGPGNP